MTEMIRISASCGLSFAVVREPVRGDFSIGNAVIFHNSFPRIRLT